jgi:hypothetical protein
MLHLLTYFDRVLAQPDALPSNCHRVFPLPVFRCFQGTQLFPANAEEQQETMRKDCAKERGFNRHARALTSLKTMS